MSVGDKANVGMFSYVAIGRESTFKTYNTATAGLDFLSFSMKTTKENRIIEQVTSTRTYQDVVAGVKSVEGEMEFYGAADNDAVQYILQNAMGGGTITTATAAGDTIGGGVLEHTYALNNFENTYTSLAITARKGDSTNGKSFGYAGCRVGEVTFSAEIDDALKISTGIVACDTTTTVIDGSSLFPNIVQTPLNFDGTRFSIEGTFASLTSSAFWHVQSVEFGINNSLKSDSDSRRLGSDVLDVLPPGMVQFTLNFTMRFDTLTAYSAMLNQTRLAAQLEFAGATYSGSSIRRKIAIDLPTIYVADGGDPEIGGPDEILKSEVSCIVVRDPTSGGYAARMRVYNKTTSY
jgi:hypothetical protein